MDFINFGILNLIDFNWDFDSFLEKSDTVLDKNIIFNYTTKEKFEKCLKDINDFIVNKKSFDKTSSVIMCNADISKQNYKNEMKDAIHIFITYGKINYNFTKHFIILLDELNNFDNYKITKDNVLGAFWLFGVKKDNNKDLNKKILLKFLKSKNKSI